MAGAPKKIELPLTFLNPTDSAFVFVSIMKTTMLFVLLGVSTSSSKIPSNICVEFEELSKWSFLQNKTVNNT